MDGWIYHRRLMSTTVINRPCQRRNDVSSKRAFNIFQVAMSLHFESSCIRRDEIYGLQTLFYYTQRCCAQLSALICSIGI